MQSSGSRKHALECLRLAADCKQLAVKTESPILQSHFVRMAGVWGYLGGSRPSDAKIRKLH